MKALMDPQFIDSIPTAFREGDANAMAKQEESDNVLLVEKVYRTIAGGDFASLRDYLADEVTLEIIGPTDAPFTGLYQGCNQVIEATRQNFSLLEGQRPEILSVVAQGNTVIVVGRESGRFQPTGREYEVHWMHQYTFSNRKVARIRELLDTASILKVAEPVA